jgi:hypothetical protein
MARMPLFDENDSWTPEAVKCGREFSEVIEEVMDLYAGMGYSIRELAAIAHGCVTDAECKLVLDRKAGRTHASAAYASTRSPRHSAGPITTGPTELGRDETAETLRELEEHLRRE